MLAPAESAPSALMCSRRRTPCRRRMRHPLRQRHVRTGEIGAIRLAGLAVQDADQVDGGVTAAQQTVQRGVVVDVVGRERDAGQDLQIPPAAIATGGHQDLVLSAAGKPGDQATADEAGAADDKDTHEQPCSSGFSPILPCGQRIRKGAPALKNQMESSLA